MARRIDRYFEQYAACHRTPGNKLCHYVGIPLIVTTLFGLLGSLPIGSGSLAGAGLIRMDCGVVLWLAALIFYLSLDWKLAVPFALFTAGLYFLGRAIPLGWLWGLFVLGWIFQGVGHYRFEKNSPAFVKNFEHLLIGPLWIFA